LGKEYIGHQFAKSMTRGWQVFYFRWSESTRGCNV